MFNFLSFQNKSQLKVYYLYEKSVRVNESVFYTGLKVDFLKDVKSFNAFKKS